MECIKNVVCGSAYSITERVKTKIQLLLEGEESETDEINLLRSEAYGANLVAINTMYDLSIIGMREREYIIRQLERAERDFYPHGFSLWRAMTEFEEGNR